MPLEQDVPRDTQSSKIISFLKQDSSFPYVRINGTGDTQWGSPVYVSELSTPAVRLDCVGWCPAAIPDRIHLPAAASVPNTSDGTVTLYDEYRGYVLGLWRASRNADGSWNAQGADVYYSNSNGLSGVLPGSDEARNAGHRGLNSMTRVLRYDEVRFGSVDHVLELFVNTARMEHVFPMTGHEFHGTTDVNAPPEGTRIRIKSWINLDGYNLSPAAKVIATALQRYGAVIGDQTGGPASIGVENTVLGGRGDLWRSLLTPDALKGIPFDAFEVIELGYDPTALP